MAFQKCSGGGGRKVATGTFVNSSANQVKVTLGFKPKYLAIWTYGSNSLTYSAVYNEDVSSSKQIIGSISSSSTASTVDNIPYTASTSRVRIVSIDNDGFTLNKISSYNGTEGHYFAIG